MKAFIITIVLVVALVGCASQSNHPNYVQTLPITSYKGTKCDYNIKDAVYTAPHGWSHQTDRDFHNARRFIRDIPGAIILDVYLSAGIVHGIYCAP